VVIQTPHCENCLSEHSGIEYQIHRPTSFDQLAHIFYFFRVGGIIGYFQQNPTLPFRRYSANIHESVGFLLLIV